MATVVVSLVAVAEFVVLIAIALAVFGRPILDAAQGSSSHTARAASKATRAGKPPAAPAHTSAIWEREPAKAPRLPRSETSVLILNGNGIAGAAAGESESVRRKGYIIAEVGNAKRTDYRRSVVMYRPGYKPEAARLARDLRLYNVSPLDGIRAHDLMGAHVAVVIGRS
jgi:LytR cell envelope-related transcriptional attenuator